MLRSEALDAFELPPVSPPPSTCRLPLYVEPAPDEALLSWLLRLATRLGVSLQVLAREAFGIDEDARSQWWRRPAPSALERITDRTGISIERLRGMTLATWQPVYRDDEASERFSHRRFTVSAPDWRAFRYVVCHQCLKADATPYLRLSWTIGWMAVCPRHGIVMTARCERCLGKLRIPRAAWNVPFSPLECTGCADELRFVDCIADPPVIRLQDTLLRGKCDGLTEIKRLGQFSWEEVIALADVLIGMFWTDLTFDEQHRLYGQFKEDINAHSLEHPSIRYTDLAFFAWLTGGWPAGAGAEVGRDMLARWASGKPNHIFRHLGQNWAGPWDPGTHDMGMQIVARLRELLEAQ